MALPALAIAAGVMGFGDGSCPSKSDNYVAKTFASICVQTIPFIGGAIDTWIPKVPDQQGALDDLNSNISANTSAWRDEITKFTITNAVDLNNLITTILGTPGEYNGYADIVSQYYLEPVKEQSNINKINIFFLTIMMSILVYYLVSIKKNV